MKGKRSKKKPLVREEPTPKEKSVRTVEIRGRGSNWKIFYPDESGLASPINVFDKDGNYKETIRVGAPTDKLMEAHFVGPKEEALEYAEICFSGYEIKVVQTKTKQEAAQKARETKTHSESEGKQRTCSLCHQPGHNARTCDLNTRRTIK